MAKKKNKLKLNDRIQSLRRSYNEHATIKYIVIVSVFLVLIVGLLSRGIFATHVSSQYDTTIRDWQQIATGYTVGMTKKSYNPKANLMQVNIELKNGDMGGSVYPRLKFLTKTLHNQPNVKSEVIRAGDSSYILVLRNLKPKFGAVLIKISTDLKTNETAQESNLSDEDLGSSNEIISKNDTISKKQLDNGTVNIYINEVNKLKNENLKVKSKKQYLIETVNNEIDHLNAEKKLIKKHIESSQVKIEMDKKAIKKTEEEKKYNTDKEIKKINRENEQTISDIETNESNIKKLKTSYYERNKKIKLLKKKIYDIKNGEFDIKN